MGLLSGSGRKLVEVDFCVEVELLGWLYMGCIIFVVVYGKWDVVFVYDWVFG